MSKQIVIPADVVELVDEAHTRPVSSIKWMRLRARCDELRLPMALTVDLVRAYQGLVADSAPIHDS